MTSHDDEKTQPPPALKVTGNVTAAVDWGSTSFRAYRFDGTSVIDKVESSCGINSIGTENRPDPFYSILEQQIGSWLSRGDSILLCGMITSANGWIETPYIPCPLDCAEIAGSLTTHTVNHHTLLFTPGVCQSIPHPDVMRGEEVQLLGLEFETDSTTAATQVVIMPGTHSKWAVVDQCAVRHFQTIITGELFQTLLNHTLIGRLAETNTWCEPTFLEAVEIGYNSDRIISQLFTARSAVLLEQRRRSEVCAYLSGLLIGNEIREATDNLPTLPASVTLIGAPSLTSRYLNALNRLGIAAVQAVPRRSYPDITAAGFASIITQLEAGG